MHGFNPLGLGAWRSFVDVEAKAKPAPRRGFRNLLGPPEVVFSADGLMQQADGDEKLTKLIRKLASRTAAGRDAFWSDRLKDREPAEANAGSARIETWENPHIPAGYTYLLQLVAHDLVASSVSLSIDVERAQVENAREDALLLETIYGDGPELTPEPYEFTREHLKGRGLVPRTRLRLGPLRPKIAGTWHCPHRDLGRGTGTAGIHSGNRPINYVEDGARDSDRAKLWLTETMVADTRNDSHALLSQLTVLFHLLHNVLTAKLEKCVPARPKEWSEQEFAWRRFVCARTAVTLIYRRIIRRDLMCKLLHPEVYKAYNHRGFRLEQSEGLEEGIPLEFSHGAFRFGHAMVRDAYRVNDPKKSLLMDFGLQQSPHFPYKLPVKDDWMVDWRLFFEVDPETEPNFSRRIGPHYARPMLADLVFTLENGRGLPFLDHFSAAHAGLWSVPKLMARIKEQLAKRSDSSLADIFITYDLWRALLSGWLGESDGLIPLSDDDIKRLANDPPLPLFVLFEAAHAISDGVPVRKGGGARLGALGSIIVAETIYGALDRNKLMFDDRENLSKALRDCCTKLLNAPKALDEVAIGSGGERRDINEMKDVILFLAANGAFPP
ncbi:MAG: peroxidase family protein [Hyphomicrobiaceae bacterium]